MTLYKHILFSSADIISLLLFENLAKVVIYSVVFFSIALCFLFIIYSLCSRESVTSEVLFLCCFFILRCITVHVHLYHTYTSHYMCKYHTITNQPALESKNILFVQKTHDLDAALWKNRKTFAVKYVNVNKSLRSKWLSFCYNMFVPERDEGIEVNKFFSFVATISLHFRQIFPNV